MPNGETPKTKGLRTWIEINAAAAENNYNIFRRLIGFARGRATVEGLTRRLTTEGKNRLLMAVVKSNAYGHGLFDFAKLMQKFGVDWFGVDSITEALALREAGIKKKILVLGYTLPEKFKDAAENNISLTISCMAHLAALKRFKFQNPLKIHLKLDTGMHRQGFLPEKVLAAANSVKKLRNKVALEGVYTHFASAKNPNKRTDTLKQIKLFEVGVDTVKKAGFNPLRHASATGGTIVFPEARYDLARVGIGLYGLWQAEETRSAFAGKLNLKPVLSWKTIVGEVKSVAKGERIGYDFTEKLRKQSEITILPIGYWHGFPRALSSIGRVLIKGKSAKILGRVSMDMVAVDVSNVKNAKIGDEAVLIGRSGQNEITADEFAKSCGTTNYEVITRLNPLIKRIVV